MHTKHFKINMISCQTFNSLLNLLLLFIIIIYYCVWICSASLTDEKRKDIANINLLIHKI